VKAYAISMTAILLIWAGVAYWGFRELQKVMEMTP
jgi:hypothetical protein